MSAMALQITGVSIVYSTVRVQIKENIFSDIKSISSLPWLPSLAVYLDKLSQIHVVTER